MSFATSKPPHRVPTARPAHGTAVDARPPGRLAACRNICGLATCPAIRCHDSMEGSTYLGPFETKSDSKERSNTMNDRAKATATRPSTTAAQLISHFLRPDDFPATGATIVGVVRARRGSDQLVAALRRLTPEKVFNNVFE